MTGEIVTSCPLCLALSDPADMLDIEIDRVVPKGRAHVLLCRICASAVVRAMAAAGEALAKELIELDLKEAQPAPAGPETVNAATRKAAEEFLEGIGEKVTPEKPEEPDDGKTAA